MFPLFSFFPMMPNPAPYMRKEAPLDSRTPAQRKAAELKLQQNRAKRDRRKAAKKSNKGNQFRF